MAGFRPTTYSGKSTMPSTFSRASQKDVPRVCLSLTMPPATKSVLITHSLLGGWLKVRGLHLPLFLFLIPFSPEERLGTPSRWQPHAPWHTSYR